MGYANLVLVHNPALEFLVVSIVAAPLLDDVVDGEVLQACVLRERFAVRRLPHAWRASDDDVGLGAHCVFCCGVEEFGRGGGRGSNWVPVGQGSGDFLFFILTAQLR